MAFTAPIVKTEDEIARIRNAAALAHEVLEYAGGLLHPGIRASAIDKKIAAFLNEHGASAANLEFDGYEYASSISRWDEVAHALPLPSKIIRRGDIVCIDVGVKKDGVYADAARSFTVEETHPKVRALKRICRSALHEGIACLSEGILLSDYGKVVERIAGEHGYGICRELTGHGVGRDYHEPPKVLNFYHVENDIPLKAGMVFAFELMLNLGSEGIALAKDGWTFHSDDGNPSAHFEDTVLIEKNGVSVLS